MASSSLDTTVISVRPQPAVYGTCDLCARPPTELPAVVHVQQTAGATTRLRSCASCARALRRVGAVSRGLIRIIDGDLGPQTSSRKIGLTNALLRAAELVQDYADSFVAGGVAYRVRAMGAERHDGTWIGWLEFADPRTGRLRRTERETTQPNRVAAIYWASGLEPIYLQGAFERSREMLAVA